MCVLINHKIKENVKIKWIKYNLQWNLKECKNMGLCQFAADRHHQAETSWLSSSCCKEPQLGSSLVAHAVKFCFLRYCKIKALFAEIYFHIAGRKMEDGKCEKR